MFSVLPAQTLFDQSQLWNRRMFGGNLPNASQQYKRRRGYSGPIRCDCTSPDRESSFSGDDYKGNSSSSQAITYSVDKISEGFVLSILKEIPEREIYSVIYSKAKDIKERNYRPSYNIVRDIFGNEYYVEEKCEEDDDDDELIRAAMSQIDLNSVGKKLSRESYQDYNIEIERRGSSVCISSSKDNFNKEFEFGINIEDAVVIDCNIEKKYNQIGKEIYYTVLKIGITEKQEAKELSDKSGVRVTPSSSTHKKKYHYKKHRESQSSSKHHNHHYSQNKRKRTNSTKPVLEEIEDIEFVNYEESLQMNPPCLSLIEEIQA
ncbi:hypothetical protein Kpol_1017p1 [Vanderwaltozyma polyspora DSM 70294]|uniref:Uncharacterized protein n=1 Tax=Vanderwaltozyma polyspora (strain ATCC 22028 / DSM 70294 / BCRC 21397 / CBS 2163 / NBRC 10782 / NRRL Y-8283 / UCD 57-17) TaxID=436907 RepID=A7TRC8_VANPO|nr:uncharacterized protein Kpol_1017p1 [Vanderwaltozyma polyspora DSM 70294]EDO15167.1 hypothetical protein Kpol_1017p1 [Vanderwaltozyma polyspora DSM 70294]